MTEKGHFFDKIVDCFIKIAYNNIKLKAKYYFLFPSHLKVGLGILFYLYGLFANSLILSDCFLFKCHF